MHTLDINITNNCNYKCEFCYTNPKAKGDIKQEVFEKALEFAKLRQVKYLSFCGGEPLLNKNFKELTILAKQSGFKLILRTNGIYFDRYMDFISDNFEWVCFSLDGTKEVNDKMRVAKNNITNLQKFNIPIDNIIELRKRNKRIKIMLASVVSKVNYKKFPLLGKYILKKKLPIDLWKIYLFKPSEGRALTYESKHLLNKDNFLKVEKKIDVESLKENGIKTIFQNYSVKKSECIIVTAGGDLNLAQNKLFNLEENTLEEIDNFFSKLEIEEVEANKKATYF